MIAAGGIPRPHLFLAREILCNLLSPLQLHALPGVPMIRFLLFAFVLSVPAALAAPQAEQPPKTRGEVVLSEQAAAIHREALLIDGHNDLPYELRTKDGPSFRNIDIAKPQKAFHTDIERLKKGNVGVQF